jgi:ribosomal protein L11 methyltransferase
VYLWRRTAEPYWVKAREDLLQALADGKLVIVRAAGRKRLQLEIVCSSRSKSRALLRDFGGSIQQLPRNWLERFTCARKSQPIKIGNRLIVAASQNELRRSDTKPALLVIPASVAFGTGEHATTAMSLHLLEQLTRRWKNGWSLLDIGTGSGILALAAKRFGASRVVGIDNDPIAVSTAKSNARLNNIRGATFQLVDVRKWRLHHDRDVITANLYSDLLIEILPRLKRSPWLILSGVLLRQTNEFVRALRQNNIAIVSTKHRGNWLAVLAQSRTPE